MCIVGREGGRRTSSFVLYPRMDNIYNLTTTGQGGDRKSPMVTQMSSCRFAGDSMDQRNREPGRECVTSVEFPSYRVSCMPTVGCKNGMEKIQPAEETIRNNKGF